MPRESPPVAAAEERRKRERRSEEREEAEREEVTISGLSFSLSERTSTRRLFLSSTLNIHADKIRKICIKREVICYLDLIKLDVVSRFNNRCILISVRIFIAKMMSHFTIKIF